MNIFKKQKEEFNWWAICIYFPRIFNTKAPIGNGRHLEISFPTSIFLIYSEIGLDFGFRILGCGLGYESQYGY